MDLDKKHEVWTSEKKHMPYSMGRNLNIHQMHGIVRSSTTLLEYIGNGYQMKVTFTSLYT